MFLTWNHCLESFIRNIAFSSESGDKYAQIKPFSTSKNSLKQI